MNTKKKVIGGIAKKTQEDLKNYMGLLDRKEFFYSDYPKLIDMGGIMEKIDALEKEKNMIEKQLQMNNHITPMSLSFSS